MKFGFNTMENDRSTITFRPINPHFFKPILPSGFSQLNIPSAFFFKYLSTQKKYEQAVLRTSHGEWMVDIEGTKFGGGWEKFARDNNLDVGDFLVFKLRENMVFNVVVFGPSACEKEFVRFNAKQVLEHETSSVKSITKKSASTNSMETSAVFSSGYPYFVSTIKPYCLNASRFYIPLDFARDNGLNRISKMILKDKKQRSWEVRLVNYGRNTFITRGWSTFCKENGLKLGDSILFELIHKGKRSTANIVPTN